MTKLESLRKQLLYDKNNLLAADFQAKLKSALKNSQYARFELFIATDGNIYPNCESRDLVQTFIQYTPLPESN